MVFVSMLPFRVGAQNNTISDPENAVVTVKGVSYQIDRIVPNSNDNLKLKEGYKAIDLQLKYTLSSKLGFFEIFGIFSNAEKHFGEGKFEDAEGNIYAVEGINSQELDAVSEQEKEYMLTLTTVVPKDIDSGTLSFVLEDKRYPLMFFIKD